VELSIDFCFFLRTFHFASCSQSLAVTCVSGEVDSVYVIDRSSSMDRDCGDSGGSSKINCVKNGMRTIIDSPKMVNASMGIYVYDANVNRFVDLTKVAGNQTFFEKIALTPLLWRRNCIRGCVLKAALIYLNTTSVPGKKKFIGLITDGRLNMGARYGYGR